MNSVVVSPNNYIVEINTQNPTVVSVTQDVLTVTAIAEQGPRGPAGASGTEQLANTLIIAGDGLSGGGNLVSNVNLAVDSTVVRTSGDQSIDGNKRFGSTLYIDAANSRVGVNNLDPRIDFQIGDVGLGTYRLYTTSPMSNQIADSWNASDFRSAKYQVQVYSNTVNQYEISEIFLMHDDSNVYITEYAIINQGERLMTFDASIHNSTVRLLCTPNYAVNEVKVFRTVLSA
jgi:hypothetical protein